LMMGERSSLVGEEDLPHIGCDTAQPPPPRRLMGAGRLRGASVSLASFVWMRPALI
jgi:hypothetical protein